MKGRRFVAAILASMMILSSFQFNSFNASAAEIQEEMVETVTEEPEELLNKIEFGIILDANGGHFYGNK